MTDKMQWRMVPVEPTGHMLAEAQKAWLADPMRKSTTLYKAMLDAAPSPRMPSAFMRVPVPCRWTYEGDPTFAWNTECGNLFQITDGTPEENQFKFCCYCGGAITNGGQVAGEGAGEI